MNGIDLGKIGGCGIMPVAKAGKGKVMFLLGREQNFVGWKGSGKYADFGGGIEKNENVIECAAREGYEESMGFLGSREEIREKVNPKSKDFVGVFVHPERKEHMLFVVKMYYNKYMPKVFDDVFKYVTRCGKKLDEGKYVIDGCPEGFMEKDEVRWFSFNELKDMVEREDKRLRPFFVRCLEVMFGKYKGEEDMFKVL